MGNKYLEKREKKLPNFKESCNLLIAFIIYNISEVIGFMVTRFELL